MDYHFGTEGVVDCTDIILMMCAFLLNAFATTLALPEWYYRFISEIIDQSRVSFVGTYSNSFGQIHTLTFVILE